MLYQTGHFDSMCTWHMCIKAHKGRYNPYNRIWHGWRPQLIETQLSSESYHNARLRCNLAQGTYPITTRLPWALDSLRERLVRGLSSSGGRHFAPRFPAHGRAPSHTSAPYVDFWLPRAVFAPAAEGPRPSRRPTIAH